MTAKQVYSQRMDIAIKALVILALVLLIVILGDQVLTIL